MVRETARRRNARRSTRLGDPIGRVGSSSHSSHRGMVRRDAGRRVSSVRGSSRPRPRSCVRQLRPVPAGFLPALRGARTGGVSAPRRPTSRSVPGTTSSSCAATGGSSACGGRRWSRSSPKAGSHDRRDSTGVPRRALADRRRHRRGTATRSAPQSRRQRGHGDARLDLRRVSVSRRVAGTRGRARSAGGAAQRRSFR
jgi:hypothetical protein